jgi:predicted transposase YbfD/YdcC
LSVPEKTNEITAIPNLLDQLAEAGQLKGALVTIDAIGCQVDIADKIVGHGARRPSNALKGNQPIMEADTGLYFDAAPDAELAKKTAVEKGHGRIETARLHSFQQRRLDHAGSQLSRRAAIFRHQDPGQGSRARRTSCPVQLRDAIFHLVGVLRYRAPVGRRPRPLRRRKQHWLLDVEFKDDFSRYRVGHGAKNMATPAPLRPWPRAHQKSKGSVKSRRKAAGWSPDLLLEILQLK